MFMLKENISRRYTLFTIETVGLFRQAFIYFSFLFTFSSLHFPFMLNDLFYVF